MDVASVAFACVEIIYESYIYEILYVNITLFKYEHHHPQAKPIHVHHLIISFYDLYSS